MIVATRGDNYQRANYLNAVETIHRSFMKPKSKILSTLPESYPLLLADIKSRIRESQLKAALAINQ